MELFTKFFVEGHKEALFKLLMLSSLRISQKSNGEFIAFQIKVEAGMRASQKILLAL